MTILWQMTSISEATEQKGISGVKLGTLTHRPRGIPLGVGGLSRLGRGFIFTFCCTWENQPEAEPCSQVSPALLYSQS